VKLSPEHCAAIARSRLGKPLSPIAIAKALPKIIEKMLHPDMQTLLSESSRKNWNDANYRTKVTANISSALLDKWKDPEFRAKKISYTSTQKICKKHGLIPLNECYVGRTHLDAPRIECKLCVDARNKQRRDSHKVL
jgi:hypothetical protein